MFIKISKNPDFKQIEKELGVKIKRKVMRYGNHILEIEAPVAGREDEILDKFKEKFVGKHVSMINYKTPARFQPPPDRPDRIHESAKLANQPLKERLRTLEDAVEHYEQSLSYAEHRMGRRGVSADLDKKTKRVRHVAQLLDEANRSLEELYAGLSETERESRKRQALLRKKAKTARQHRRASAVDDVS